MSDKTEIIEKYGLTDGLLRCNPAASETERFSKFKDVLIYVLEHTPSGAVGINLTQFYSTTVEDASEQVPQLKELALSSLAVPNLINGGPVGQDQAWVLESGCFKDQHSIRNNSMTLSLSADGIKRTREPKSCICGVGLFGWGKGQLENELGSSLWHHFPVDQLFLNAVPFDDPPQFSIDLFLKLRFGQAPHSSSQETVEGQV